MPILAVMDIAVANITMFNYSGIVMFGDFSDDGYGICVYFPLSPTVLYPHRTVTSCIASTCNVQLIIAHWH